MADDQMEVEIDDTLYSRQRYVLGDSAMKKMAQSDVFISGMNGLGIEIAKNVVLAGVKSVMIHDANTVQWSDLAAQFFLRESDIKENRNRAEASLPQLRELNSNVDVHSCTHLIDDSTDLSFLRTYRCVIFADAIPISTLNKINSFCRSQNPVIHFITGIVRGVLSFGFCDFGDEFTVFDKNGEEPLEFFISKITKSNPATVSCLENERHGLEDGDFVEFKEVVGMEKINGEKFMVKVLSPTQFSILVNTTGDDFGVYTHGGRVKQLKQSQIVTFNSLSDELSKPTIQITDFCKVENLNQYVLFIQALDQFQTKNEALPRIHNDDDCTKVYEIAKEINSSVKLVNTVDNVLCHKLTSCSSGLLPPLATTIGGVLAQECLISLTGKFSPLKQWLFLDCIEILEGLSANDVSSNLSDDRYISVRACLGDTLVQKLGKLKLFMIGCGAIGCEMLKGYAQLGIGRGSEGGVITITDNDIIEKSNLNRQFLFRDQHIQKHKSQVAASATRDINPDLRIDAQCYKVFPGTEESIYNDHFFENLDLVVNALDNIEARRYVDSRCITNMKPLLESGTLGTKGHVQVILPEKTESYSSQRDPPEKDVPYCTLKSFPATIEHTIQWARDKFESLWTQKPKMYEKFWRTHRSPSDLLKVIQGQELIPDGSVKCIKLLHSRPSTWEDCVSAGRIRFERYFNHKAKNLLQAFPLDTKMPDGSLFWQSPKRPPKILEFSLNDPVHMLFVKTFAILYAQIHNIPYNEQDIQNERLSSIITNTEIPQFKPSGKRIETDENAKRPEVVEMSEDEIEKTRRMLSEYVGKNTTCKPGVLSLNALLFEKDDDSNGHIDFITASSNLRAQMYSIEEADRFKTKLIAGRIVPAIATTTAAVSGLVCLELIKIVMDLPLEKFKNAFMNLALPELPLLLTEPAEAQRSVVTANISYTLWTQWKIKGSDQMTLKDFLSYVKTEYHVEPTMVVLGVKMIYVPIMPGHRKRLPQTMKTLLKQGPDKKYVDLTLSFENEQGEDVPGPPVRYYF